MKSRVRIAVLLAVVAAIAVAARMGFDVRELTTSFVEALRSQGDFGLIWLGLAYIPASLFFFPAFLLTLAGGFAFGVPKTLIAVSLGSTAGATAAFWAGRTFLRHLVEQRVAGSVRFRALDAAVAEQGFKIVILTRLSPVLPFNLLNYAFGLTRVRARDFMLASWLGMFPGTVMYVVLGSAAKSLREVLTGQTERTIEQQLLFGFGLLATVVVSVLLARIARRALESTAIVPDAALHSTAHNEEVST
jgi:uncharacterized membrane protein YdjX (TVP38/TMEM64 family)